MQDIQDSPTIPRPAAPLPAPPRASVAPTASAVLPWLILALSVTQGVISLQLSQRITSVRDQIRVMERGLPALADQKINATLPALDERTRRLEEAASNVTRGMTEANASMQASLRAAEARIERKLPQLIDNYIESKLRRFERR